jgi:molecular chaperone IbpA
MKNQLPSVLTGSVNALEKWMGDMNNTFVDFDRVFERFDRAFPVNVRTVTYPPVDLLKIDGGYLIQLAVAGYTSNDINVELRDDGVLTVTGKQESKADDSQYLFRGISARSFVRKWQLFDTDTVETVNLKDGMLTLKIMRAVPAEPSVKRIPVVSL